MVKFEELFQEGDDALKADRKKRVGGYILGRTLGEGSFAKVRLGTHIATNEKVNLLISYGFSHFFLVLLITVILWDKKAMYVSVKLFSSGKLVAFTEYCYNTSPFGGKINSNSLFFFVIFPAICSLLSLHEILTIIILIQVI